MKMIIDISKEVYDDIKCRFEKHDYECGYIVASAIVFGTPLEEELEKVKDKINIKRENLSSSGDINLYKKCKIQGYSDSIGILNKCISDLKENNK